MLQFWDKYKKKIIAVLIAVMGIIALVTSQSSLNASLFESAIGVVVTPFQDIISGVSSWAESTITSARDQSSQKEKMEAIQEELALLQQENRRLALYEEENKRLSALLNIAQKYPDYDSFGASISAKSPGAWYNTFTLDKGTRDGVSAEMVLIAPEGIVGKVLESGLTYSKSQSILDSRSSVPAMSARTGDLGVVKGDYTLMNDGLCKMEYIDAESEIMIGDEIVTSHLSEIYPTGLLIGKVIRLETDTNGLTKYAIIEPYVDFKHLDTLLVLNKTTGESES